MYIVGIKNTVVLKIITSISRAYPHQAKVAARAKISKNKRKGSKNKRQTWNKILTFAFAFARFEQGLTLVVTIPSIPHSNAVSFSRTITMAVLLFVTLLTEFLQFDRFISQNSELRGAQIGALWLSTL